MVTLRIWATIPKGIVLHVHGVRRDETLTLSGRSPELEAYDLPVNEKLSSKLGFELSTEQPEARVWLGYIEALPQANSQQVCWATRGRYHLDGLMAQVKSDQPFELTRHLVSPTTPVSVTHGELLLAYAEVREWHLTAVEDEGIRERALGGIDTTTRTQVVTQFKLATVADTFDAQTCPVLRVKTAATLEVGLAEIEGSLDPCALPTLDGFTGDSNRLYRFEVHRGGMLGEAEFTWSRDNGSQLWPVMHVSGDGREVVVPADAPIRDGDLLEFLSTTLELSDVELGHLETPRHWRPPSRAQGLLFRVRLNNTSTNTTGRVLEVRNATTGEPGVIEEAWLKHDGLKVRRWDGHFVTPERPPEGDPVVTLQDGLQLTLRDDEGKRHFRTGDYWQYQARPQHPHDAAAWSGGRLPDGPERLYTPLALLRAVEEALEGERPSRRESEAASDDPLEGVAFEVVRWCDTQFTPLCSLSADDIDYDGDAVGLEAETVQDAIDTLARRPTTSEGGCFDIVLLSDEGDDTVRLQKAIDKLGTRGGVIGLRRSPRSSGVFRGHPRSAFTAARSCSRAVPRPSCASSSVKSIPTRCRWLQIRDSRCTISWSSAPTSSMRTRRRAGGSPLFDWLSTRLSKCTMACCANSTDRSRRSPWRVSRLQRG